MSSLGTGTPTDGAGLECDPALAIVVSRFVSKESESRLSSGVLLRLNEPITGLKTQDFEKKIYRWDLTRMVS